MLQLCQRAATSHHLFKSIRLVGNIANAQPILPDEFATLMTKYGISRSDKVGHNSCSLHYAHALIYYVLILAVAVSGGADSLSLCRLAHEWFSSNRDLTFSRVSAIMVNHSLRKDSSIEAETVRQWMEARGISVSTRHLEWPEGHPKKTELQNLARKARREALLRECISQGVSCLFLGHHLGDQNETQLLRLARASGPLGLRGMPEVEILQLYPHEHLVFENSGTSPFASSYQLRIVRPLLHYSKVRKKHIHFRSYTYTII